MSDPKSVSELMKMMLEQKLVSEEMLFQPQIRPTPRERRGHGLLILGPTRAWAVDLASIVGIRPQERYVRVTSYDDPRGLHGLSPAGIIMAVPDDFQLQPEVRHYLIPMLHDLARFQR